MSAIAPMTQHSEFLYLQDPNFQTHAAFLLLLHTGSGGRAACPLPLTCKIFFPCCPRPSPFFKCDSVARLQIAIGDIIADMKRGISF
jgi:hypothetical protein